MVLDRIPIQFLLSAAVLTFAASTPQNTFAEDNRKKPCAADISYAELRTGTLDRSALGDSLDGLSSRIRRSALLPEVNLQIRLWNRSEYDSDLHEEFESGTRELEWDSLQNEYERRHRNRRMYRIDVSWDLGDLMYSRGELAVERERRYRESRKRELLEEITDIFFRRRRLCERLEDPSISYPERRKLLLQIEKANAQLRNAAGEELAGGGRS